MAYSALATFVDRFIPCARTPYKHCKIEANEEIRLFTFEPQEYDTDDIAISIESARFGNLPSYRCISYVWGEAKDTEPITCDGRELNVTANLWYALHRLRERYSSKTKFWADQICINQNDNEEKTCQVNKMSQIFPNAERVICWLGEEEEEKEKCIPLAYDALRQWDKARKDEALRQRLSVEWGLDDLSAAATKQCESLRYFFSNKWFRRAWMLQEVFVENPPVLLWGSYPISWDVVLVAFFMICTTFGIHESLRALGKDIMYALPMFNVYNDRGKGSIRMSELLVTALAREATKPQDLIFSLLGIMEHEKVFYPPAAYGLKPTQVYTLYTRAVIQKEGSLDILNSAWDDGGYRWYWKPPTWALLLPKYEPNGRSVLRQLRKTNYPRGGATGVTEPLLQDEASPLSRRLTLGGKALDRITQIHDVRPFVAKLSKQRLRWQDILDAAEQYSSFLGLSDVYERTNEPLAAAFLRTILVDNFYIGCCHRSRDYETAIGRLHARFLRERETGLWSSRLQSISGIRECDELGADAKKLHELARDTLHFPSFENEDRIYRKSSVETTSRARSLEQSVVIEWLDETISSELIAELKKNTLHDKLATGGNGDLALVPGGSKPGDELCLLMGGFLPYVLRRERYRERYRLMGDAYVHGCLDGTGGTECEELCKKHAEDGSQLVKYCLI